MKQWQQCFSVNRLCGSGFQSIVNGVQEILVGDSEIVLTGGTDNMSASPYAVRDIRFAPSNVDNFNRVINVVVKDLFDTTLPGSGPGWGRIPSWRT